MKRRDFLKLSAACGLSVAAPLAAERAGWARLTGRPSPVGLYEGELLVVVTGPGGWDQTMFCDPHPDLCNSYSEDQIETEGNISFAPSPANRDFFSRFGDMTVVFNGVDMLTNNHGVGPRANASGRVTEGFPNISAMLAASHGLDLPLPFLTHGVLHYDGTMGLVSKTRSRAGPHLALLMEPHRQNPGSSTVMTTYMDAGMTSAIQAAQQERLAGLRDGSNLPRISGNIDAMYLGNASAGDLVRLRDFLPTFDEDERRRSIQFMMASFAAGLSVSASIVGSANAFDSHENNDPNQVATFAEMLGTLTYIWEEAERQNVADRLTVLACSDFGRTPQYNDRNFGKDHWQIGTMLVTSPRVDGNRVIGATDDGLMPVPVDPETLDLVEGAGVVLEPKHVHQALRDLVGVDPELDEAFPLRADPMPQGLLVR